MPQVVSALQPREINIEGRPVYESGSVEIDVDLDRIFELDDDRDEMAAFHGRSIDQPSLFIAGAADWGVHQTAGLVDRMQRRACSDLQGIHLVEGAGHWVQQEQPRVTVELLLDFLDRNGLGQTPAALREALAEVHDD